MAKPNPYERKMFGDIPKKIFDENAFDHEQIRLRIGRGQTETYKLIRKKLEAGEWEQVWKFGGHVKPRVAYRKKK